MPEIHLRKCCADGSSSPVFSHRHQPELVAGESCVEVLPPAFQVSWYSGFLCIKVPCFMYPVPTPRQRRLFPPHEHGVVGLGLLMTVTCGHRSRIVTWAAGVLRQGPGSFAREPRQESKSTIIGRETRLDQIRAAEASGNVHSTLFSCSAEAPCVRDRRIQGRVARGRHNRQPAKEQRHNPHRRRHRTPTRALRRAGHGHSRITGQPVALSGTVCKTPPATVTSPECCGYAFITHVPGGNNLLITSGIRTETPDAGSVEWAWM